ncbi:MAG: DUF4870 domain-containing protein [Verrucomicrobiales bacterium]|nr:DUF4870 domain-containing protein [Verrucomicrobiales bacterium]
MNEQPNTPSEGEGTSPPPAPSDPTPQSSSAPPPSDPTPHGSTAPPLHAVANSSVTDQTERNWALAAHLTTFSNYISIPGFIGPLIIWLAKKDEMPFASAQAKEALNFQLSLYIYLVACLILLITFIGAIIAIPGFVAISLAHIVFTIIAAIKASDGHSYLYPLTIRFIR